MGDLERVRYRGGPLDGAVLDLPPRLSDARPGRLTVTEGGKVYDRDQRRPVTTARVIEPPAAHRRKARRSPRGHR